MLRKRIATSLLLLVLFIGMQGCNSILPEDIAEPEDNDTIDAQVEIPAENNEEEGEILYDGESINFTGPLTSNYMDEVNIYAICTAGFLGLFNKMTSRLIEWPDFSDLLQNIFDAVDMDTEDLIDKEDVFVNEVLFQKINHLPEEKLAELHKTRIKYKFLEIEYKDVVKIPLESKTISANNIVVFHNPDKNILEVYFDSDDAYVKYEVKGFAEDFIRWHDDFLKREIEQVMEGVD
ncbi:MAG: hypothetical protein HPY74_15850 [Firmicutes bacterium]|nr:hypothetical protein [Bacillota bacterium]NSW92118.1 hypothetical protein [Bacillota bacterium]